MSIIKPKQIFGTLMGISFLSVFVLPARFSISRLPSVEILLAPVSRPTGAIAGWAHDRFAHELSSDQRSAEEVKRENRSLRNEVTSLSTQLRELQRKNDEHSKVDIHDYCTAFSVAGSDSGPHETLGIQGSSLQGLRDGMYALNAEGMVGQVRRVGVAGARVQLITDIGFRVRAGFVRFDGGVLHPIDAPQALVEGTGRGTMQIRGMKNEDVKKSKLQIGDAVVVDELEWPPYLQGRHLGRITAIGVRTDAPLFADITVEPPQRLMLLKEVMIVTKPPVE